MNEIIYWYNVKLYIKHNIEMVHIIVDKHMLVDTISEVFVPISDGLVTVSEGFVSILFSYNGYVSVFKVYVLFQKFRRKFCFYL